MEGEGEGGREGGEGERGPCTNEHLHTHSQDGERSGDDQRLQSDQASGVGSGARLHPLFLC